VWRLIVIVVTGLYTIAFCAAFGPRPPLRIIEHIDAVRDEEQAREQFERDLTAPEQGAVTTARLQRDMAALDRASERLRRSSPF